MRYEFPPFMAQTLPRIFLTLPANGFRFSCPFGVSENAVTGPAWAQVVKIGFIGFAFP